MTIYDFGCSAAQEIGPQYFQIMAGAFAVLAIMAGFAALGATLRRATVFQATDTICGWAVAVVLMTLAATAHQGALTYMAVFITLVLFVTAAYQVKQNYFDSAFWLLALFPGFLVLTAINAAGIAKWDDFSHWVPNALYVFQYNGVPGHGLPPSISVWPGYPYALPFITYLASHLAGGFLMQGGAMANFVLLMVFAAMLTELFPPKKPRQKIYSFGLLALALFAVTLANPAFNASFTVTSQGDTAVMVVTSVLGILLWRLVAALQQKDQKPAQNAVFQASLCFALFALIKQVDIVLIGLLSFAFLIVAAKNKVFKPALMQLPLMILPALFLWLLWQHYAAAEMPSAGFGVRPFSAWRFGMAGDILGSMAQAMLKKNGLFGITLVLGVTGIASLFRKPTPFRNFALLAAIVSGGYIAFLFVTYLGASFSDGEARRAASFYRYATHVGLLGIAFVWMAAPILWRKIENRILAPGFSRNRKIVASLAALLLLPAALAIRSTWLVPVAGDETCAIRSLGHKVAAALPADIHRLTVVDAGGEGFSRYILNFEFALNAARTGHFIDADGEIDASDGDAMLGRIIRLRDEPGDGASAVLLLRSTNPQPQKIFGFTDSDPPFLLLRAGQGWRLLGF